MKKIGQELLLNGCLCLFVFKLAFFMDFLAYDKHLFPFNPFDALFLFWFGVVFVCYGLIAPIFSLQIFSNILSSYPKTVYYLKAIGWIPYAYLFGFLIYFCSKGTSLHFWLEEMWNKYPLGEILLVCSLIFAWLRKNPRFLVK